MPLTLPSQAALDFTSAVEAWEKALDVLSKTDPSPAELKQKEQYTASLKKARVHLMVHLSGLHPDIVVNESREKLPWAAAAEMLPGLYAARVATCSTSVRLSSSRSCLIHILDVRHT